MDDNEGTTMSVLTTASDSVTSAVQRRRSDTSLTPPDVVRVGLVGVLAIVCSVTAAFGLAELGRAVFTVPISFDKFNFSGYAVLTVGGVAGATVAWGLVSRYAPAPRKFLAQLAVVVTIILLLPDVWLLTQFGNPTGPVVMLMIMHITIAIVAYVELVLLAPVIRTETS